MKPSPTSVLAAVAGTLLLWSSLRAAPNVVLWDSIAPIANDAVANTVRDGWKAVPRDLFQLETNPAKASSDPGYYGRDYEFKGDAVIENTSLTAVVQSAAGKVTLMARGSAPAGVPARRDIPFAELTVTDGKGTGALPLRHRTVIRNAGDEVVIELSTTPGGSGLVLSVGRSGIIDFQPLALGKTSVVRIASPVEHLVVPGFIGDDLVIGSAELEGLPGVTVPAEHGVVGLVRGGEAMWVMTWPTGHQRARAVAGAEREGRRGIEALEFSPDGHPFHLAPIAAPGVWHREPLKPTYLEKDVATQWKRPFPARWVTQLYEGDLKTRYVFREARAEIWRGVPGSYPYPAWFEGEVAQFHFGKKVPPKGDAVIYFMEGEDTPDWVSTPADVFKATLGRSAADAILDVAGRKLRTHHRRGGEGVHRACTCGCTEVIQSIFEAGQETKRKEVIAEALGDMNYFVEQHVARIAEYQKFAGEMLQYLRSRQAAQPALKEYADELIAIAQQIPDEYGVQKENMKSAAYASDLTRQTMALTARSSTNNLPAYMELLKAWRGMGGAQDYVIAQCHTVTRKLFQQASLGCLKQPAAHEMAMEVRSRCRAILRRPDGYEIWPDY